MSHDTHGHSASPVRDALLRAISIIGLIAILVLGAWGIIQIVMGLPSFFERFSSGTTPPPTTTSSSEQIIITAPSIVTSGQPFTLAWQRKGGSGTVSYSFSYACVEGLSFAAPTPAGKYTQVPCNTPFNYTNATQTVDLIALLPTTATKQVQTALTVKAIRLSDNTATASASSTLTILPAKSAQPAASANTGTTHTSSGTSSRYTPSGRTTNLYGNPDLVARIISARPVGDRYSVQFEISNVGTNVTPYGWEFTANLPLTPAYTYASHPQQKLYPGDKIVYTLGFDAPTYNYYYNNTFSITADPQYLTNDANRSNNTASVSI
ncbi:MAG: hypothetical protein QG621_478 [Patescibacteria group bacterium]|nr:hypothetical protein [Patescibacteria group bacterium]